MFDLKDLRAPAQGEAGKRLPPRLHPQSKVGEALSGLYKMCLDSSTPQLERWGLDQATPALRGF